MEGLHGEATRLCGPVCALLRVCQNTRRSLVSMRTLALKAQALYRGWVARVDLEVRCGARCCVRDCCNEGCEAGLGPAC